LEELNDGGGISTEDLLAAQMVNRTANSSGGISYVAFHRHAERRRRWNCSVDVPIPNLPAGADNLPAPFHVYSMRQAIEEGFILDVLQNYTPYKLAFKLAHNGKELDDKEVERSEALKGIMRWVKLHPYNISQKVQVVVEHFRETVAPLLKGRGKVMVVVGSRLEAVRWRLAIDNYIKDRKATSIRHAGGVLGRGPNDVQSGPDPFTETGHDDESRFNLKGRGIREAFATRTTIKSCWSPTSSRPGSTSLCCAACMWTNGWRASRRCRRCRG
jgi:type I restriction enzyme R subunit